MRETKRYLGLELSGAKNQKTSLAVLEFYPREKKIFLLDIYDKITHRENQTSDEALLEVIEEMDQEVMGMGVNVPLELPPCVTCTEESCPLPVNCNITSVKWMRELSQKTHENSSSLNRQKDFTPYTQRPIELWIRHHIFPKIPASALFEVDETLGGNRAPLTARMNFLKRHLKNIFLYEVWTKLSVAILASRLGLPKRVIQTYRHLEDGAISREEILLALTGNKEMFIYEADLRKLSQNLTAFDAFICAWTALLAHRKQCVPAPEHFPLQSGWIQFPSWDFKL